MIEPYQYQLRQLSELPTTYQDTVSALSAGTSLSVQAYTRHACPPRAQIVEFVLLSRRVARPKPQHSHTLECEHERTVLSRVEALHVRHEHLE